VFAAQPPCHCRAWFFSSFDVMAGHGGVSDGTSQVVVGFLGFGRERERRKNKGKNASSSPVLYMSRGRTRLTVLFKTIPFAYSLFF